MTILERLQEWFTVPDAAVEHECEACGFRGHEDVERCPECGGQLEAVDTLPSYEYWGPM